MYAVCIVAAKGKVSKKAKTATVIKPKTQEGTLHETVWSLGSTLEHPAWDPHSSECGAGKFHACSRPYFCDEFRSNKSDKYVAIQVNVKDLFAWEKPIYPHKIAFRKGTVLYECDKHGKKISGTWCKQVLPLLK